MAENFSINGRGYSFASIEWRFNGVIYKGVKAITYKDGFETGYAEGSSMEPHEHTRGHYKGVEWTARVLRKTYDALLSAMGDGYGTATFDQVIAYADKNQPTTTDELIGCVFGDFDHSNERGPDPTMVEISGKALLKITNGISPVPGLIV